MEQVNINLIAGALPDWAKARGDGDGDGYGYGDGYGDGDGDGDKNYWLACLPHFAAKWPQAQQARLAELQQAGTPLAYWRSDAQGRACNGGSNEPVKPGTIETARGPLKTCRRGTLHATLLPHKWNGERWWIVAMHGEVVHDDDKLGSLKREIVGECL